MRDPFHRDPKIAIAEGIADIVYNSTDTTIVLTSADWNKIHEIENAAAVSVSVPVFTSVNKGYWLEFRKKGAGNLSINRQGTNTINAGTKIENLVAAQTFAFVRLCVESAGVNMGVQGSLGSWTD